MTTEQNKLVVRRQFELLSAGDAKGAAALWATAAFNHGKKVDPDGIEKVYEILAALKERHTIQEMVAEGEWVAARPQCEGIHSIEPSIPVNNGILLLRTESMHSSICICSGSSMGRLWSTGPTKMT
jgi:predicted RNase H-like HicB family nuclease